MKKITELKEKKQILGKNIGITSIPVVETFEGCDRNWGEYRDRYSVFNEKDVTKFGVTISLFGKLTTAYSIDGRLFVIKNNRLFRCQKCADGETYYISTWGRQ